jgi:hypothetical protein
MHFRSSTLCITLVNIQWPVGSGVETRGGGPGDGVHPSRCSGGFDLASSSSFDLGKYNWSVNHQIE